MMDFSNDVVLIVWYLTIGFFFVSIISFFAFFVLKWISSHRIKVVKRNISYYQSEAFLLDTLPKDNKKLLSYIYELGHRMNITDDIFEKEKIQQYIQDKHILTIVEKKYDKARLKIKKLHYLSLLAILNNPKEKMRFREIVYNRENSLEYVTLSLYGYALVTITAKDLFELYSMLKWLYNTKYVDRRYNQFFFALAIKDMEYNEIVRFIYMTIQDLMHIPTVISFIYALSQIEKHKQLKSIFLDIQRQHKNNAELTAAILRLMKTWNVRSNHLILENYNSSDDIVRIAIANLGLDVLNKTKHYKLICYLYDENKIVRSNFHSALLRHNITKEEILEMEKELYSENRYLTYAMSSCLEFK
jgi:hypothetical protein